MDNRGFDDGRVVLNSNGISVVDSISYSMFNNDVVTE